MIKEWRTHTYPHQFTETWEWIPYCPNVLVHAWTDGPSESSMLLLLCDTFFRINVYDTFSRIFVYDIFFRIYLCVLFTLLPSCGLSQ